MLDIMLFAFPTVLLVVALIIVIFSDSSLLSSTEREFVDRLKKLYESVKNPITKWDEKRYKQFKSRESNQPGTAKRGSNRVYRLWDYGDANGPEPQENWPQCLSLQPNPF